MKSTVIIAGIVVATMAPGVSAQNVKSLCQVEIPAEDAAAASRRAETVGFVKRVEGQVKVLRPKSGGFDELDAEVGMDLYAADAVATGANGGFDAIFTDNTTISGVADTCVEISTYVYKAAERTGEFRMRLGRGVVSVAAGEVAKSGADRMSVKIRNDTNLAVTGTRIVIRAK
ncbi:hypothetical protein G5B40_04860 [Pikeienuella piscinae]|uniref:Organic solvent tolerance-like N-terminal domain-containing protein n=1 Tax=Pikeienuella piscinae TaxID=2748098 RepID=A0A7L5BUV9_9RHOB|nr:hypothetical protein [Pikeienuella piscinae]QIE54833.1 hypothetical protein G5B40_04860 [Pikeienuella piscinae]